MKSAPSLKDQLTGELASVKSKQTSLKQQIQDRHAEGRPRLVILDDQLDELEITREKLVKEVAATAEEPAGEFQEKIAKLRAQFNPANTEIAIRKLIFLARNNAEQAKRRLMPIVRDLIQTVVIGKTPGHKPASLEVHGQIASILAAMEAATILEKRFEALARHDYLQKLRAGELDTEHKQKKLLAA